MEKKDPIGIRAPENINRLIDELAQPFGGKMKWVVVAAGVIELSRMDDEDRFQRCMAVMQQDAGEGFARFVSDFAERHTKYFPTYDDEPKPTKKSKK